MHQLYTLLISSFLLITSSCALLEVVEEQPPLDLSFAQAFQYAELANVSYQDLAEINQINAKYSLEVIHSKLDTDTAVNYFLAKSGNRYLISARGTATVSDAITDLKFKLVYNQQLGIYLHQGFATAAKTIVEELRDHLPRDAIIETTGHSLGGAVAVAIAIQLRHEGYQVLRVVTFGQPRVTDFSGAQQYATINVTRYVAEKDIVPLVPPLAPTEFKKAGLYWHIGNEVLLDDTGDYSSLNSTQSMHRAIKASYTNLTARDLDAHKMKNYLKLTSALANKKNDK